MKRLASLLMSLGIIIGLVLVASPAQAAVAPSRPCGYYYSLWAYSVDADQWVDYNGDRFECWPNSNSDDDYYPRDDKRLPTASNAGWHFFSWADEDSEVSSVNYSKNYFRAWIYTQDGYYDWNGCSGLCYLKFYYDSNDLFYIDYGTGSRKVGLNTFENYIDGQTTFSMVYQRQKSQRSVFTFIEN